MFVSFNAICICSGTRTYRFTSITVDSSYVFALVMLGHAANDSQPLT